MDEVRAEVCVHPTDVNIKQNKCLQLKQQFSVDYSDAAAEPCVKVSPQLGRTYLVGLAGLEDVTGHLGLWVVRLSPEQVGEVAEVIAVVNEPRDELRLVLEYEDGAVAAAGGDTPDERGVEHQLDFSRLHRRAAVAPLTSPADLGHQPRQHGQRGPPVQRRPADVAQGDSPVRLRRLLLILALHDPTDRQQGETSNFRCPSPVWLLCNSCHVPGGLMSSSTIKAPLIRRVASSRMCTSGSACSFPLCLFVGLNSRPLSCPDQPCLLKRGSGRLLCKHRFL